MSLETLVLENIQSLNQRMVWVGRVHCWICRLFSDSVKQFCLGTASLQTFPCIQIRKLCSHRAALSNCWGTLQLGPVSDRISNTQASVQICAPTGSHKELIWASTNSAHVSSHVRTAPQDSFYLCVSVEEEKKFHFPEFPPTSSSLPVPLTTAVYAVNWNGVCFILNNLVIDWGGGQQDSRVIYIPVRGAVISRRLSTAPPPQELYFPVCACLHIPIARSIDIRIHIDLPTVHSLWLQLSICCMLRSYVTWGGKTSGTLPSERKTAWLGSACFVQGLDCVRVPKK